MPAVALKRYNVAAKHSNGGDTHFSFWRLPASYSDEDLATLITSFESLSNGGVASTNAHPKLKVFGVIEAKFLVPAKSNVIEPYEATNSPLGYTGFMTSDDEGTLEGTTLAQPFKIENVRPDFTVPADYTATADPQNIVRQFILKHWSVRDTDDEGVIQGLEVSDVEFRKTYRLH